MKRYKFQFEPLLFQRQTLEEKARQDLAGKTKILNDLQDKLNSTFDEYRKHRLEKFKETLCAAELELFNNYANLLLDRIQEQKEALREQQKAVGKIKAKLLKLHQNKKIVETLKEKDLAAYVKDAKKNEEKEVDEINVIRHKHKEIVK